MASAVMHLATSIFTSTVTVVWVLMNDPPDCGASPARKGLRISARTNELTAVHRMIGPPSTF